MADIHIIDSIRLNHKGLRVLDEERKWINLHKQQGDLDGACAVYSLVMALLCKGLLADSDTQIFNTPNRRTQKGKFLYHFFNEKGLIQEGYSFKTLAKEINESSFNVVATRKDPRTDEGKVNLITEYLDMDIPVIISVKYDDESGHALLAIGVEKDRNNDITKILCLDPGFPRPKCAIWNSYIEVTRSPKSDKPFKYVREDRDIKVCLDDMLIIDGE